MEIKNIIIQKNEKIIEIPSEINNTVHSITEKSKQKRVITNKKYGFL